MKKVLYVATVLSHVCQFHLPYLEMLKNEGWSVHVAARNNLAEKNGLELKHTDNVIEIPFCRSPFTPKNLTAYKKLKSLIDAERYDLIVCNTPVGGILTRLASKNARKHGAKVVYIAHGFHFYKGASKKNWMVYYPIEKFFAKKCDCVVTITDEDYKLASAKFKTNVARIHGVGVDGVRHCPVTDEAKLAIRSELGVNKDAFICLCTGELNENKNQSSLLDMVPELKARIPEFKLWLAGNGPTRSALEEKIAALNIGDEVTLLGYQPKIENYVRACDVVLSASKREGLPFNVVEAMLTKRPVVVSENRGHRELVKDGVNGFMTGDNKLFAENIVKLYADKALYNTLAEGAFEYAQSYRVESAMNEFRQIIGV